MFTGIIEETGVVREMQPRGAGARLRIGCAQVLEDAMPGSSIAVNGVCLTAVEIAKGEFAADLAPETLRRTNLGRMRPEMKVNLERPLAFTGRVGGHLVQGHVDGTGELMALDELGDGNWWLRVRLPAGLKRYVIEKGSIALDGISLTVAQIEDDVVSVAIIPHTYRHTTLQGVAPGWPINVETDLMARYVEKLLGAGLGAASL